MRPGRLALIALVALAAAPGTWVRTEIVRRSIHAPIHITSLDEAAMRLGPFTLAGAWQFTSPGGRSGGYSALIANSPTSLIAASDTGRLLTVRIEGGLPVAARLERIGWMENADKVRVDIESLTHDPDSGAIWGGYEDRNAIQRLNANLEPRAMVSPPAMRGWGSNTGPEAMARLPDGRFIVIEEGEREEAGGGHHALLFDGDPTRSASAIEFTFEGPEDYRPVDLVATGDGRVLVLMRKLVWGLPPRFEGAIMIAEPADIEEGGAWRGEMLARLRPPLPTDNFEGMTLTRAADGTRHVWLISDDNMSGYQRTLLLKLRWEPEWQRARGSPARP